MSEPRPDRGPRQALTVAAVASLALATLMAIPLPRASHDCPELVVAILDAPGADAAPTRAQATALRALGPAAADALFRIAVRDSVAVDGPALRAEQRAALARCIGSLDPSVVRTVVGAHMNTITTAAEARSLLRLIEGAGRGEDVERAIRIAARHHTPRSSSVARAMADAIEAVLSREPAAFDRLAPAFERTPDALRDALIDAAARAASPRALAFLEHVLVWEADFRLAALSDVGRIAARSCVPVGEHATASLVSLLEDATGHRHTLREACMTAGRVQAHDAVAPLVDLLGHADRSIRRAAHWALCAITGLDFPNDAERWLLWLRDETKWHRTARARVAAALASDDLGSVTAALDEAAAHRYRRDAIASDVARALAHPSRTVRLRACAVLGQLGGRSVPLHVVHLLEHEDADLAAKARAVITGVVGRDVPATVEACRNEIGLDADDVEP